VRALLALVLIVVLMAGFFLVMQRLRESGRMQNCLASGRTNCATLQ
jgi:hypothetical protein